MRSSLSRVVILLCTSALLACTQAAPASPAAPGRADARGSGDTKAGQRGAPDNYFAGKTRVPLGEKFLPIVTRATERVALAEKYNAVADRASRFGLVKQEDANLQQHVTTKALDGLYLMIGEEERKIRQNPVATGSAILRKVFGAL